MTFAPLFRSEASDIAMVAIPLLFADEDTGEILFVTPPIEELFGCTRVNGMLGESVDRFVPAPLREKHKAYREAFAKNPRTRTMGEGRELLGQRFDGTTFPLRIALTPAKAGSRRVVLAHITAL